MAAEFDELLKLQRDGGSREEVVAAMKDRGLTIAQAIKASMHLFGVGLGDAKRLVASHPSWSETAQAAGPFQEDLIQAFRSAEDPEK